MLGAISLTSNNLTNNGEVITNITNCNLLTRKETNDNRFIATGGIIGYIEDACLKDIYNKKKISMIVKNSKTNNLSCGGTIGVCASSNIENAYNYNEVYITSDLSSDCVNFGTGGVVGNVRKLTNNNITLVTKCANTGKVTGEVYCNSDNELSGIGGICGINWDYSEWRDTGTINQCYNLGTIHGVLSTTNNTVGLLCGGIAGYNGDKSNMHISLCYNRGEVSVGATNSYGWIEAGGISGGGEGSVTNSYNATKDIHTITSSPYATPNAKGSAFIQFWSAWIDNCFYLKTEKTDSNYAEGPVASNVTINGTATEKTSSELKELPELLGETYWEKDTQNKNDGYPILKNNKP